MGDELTSLLILCCNEVDYTRRCLESVWQHTRAPYELILVDNGSTDGTPAYLAEVRTPPGPGLPRRGAPATRSTGASLPAATKG